MKRIEIYDSDREVLERISKATGQDIPTLIGNLLKIGSQVYARQILAAEAPPTEEPVAPRQAKRRTQKRQLKNLHSGAARRRTYVGEVSSPPQPNVGEASSPPQPKKVFQLPQKHNKETPKSDLLQAMALAKSQGKISVSAIQRGLGYSYNHAAHLFDLMRDKGLLEPGLTKSTWKWKE